MKLYIIATPIGNLEDITLRALRTLKEVDYILCEDTRVTSKLLSHYNIETPRISYHQHSSDKKKERIMTLLRDGNDLALVSDAGTPGISDPGNELLAWILASDLASRVEIVPIPGPSALVSLASVSAMPMSRFLFLGFAPHKKGRKTFFERVAASAYPVIFYESSHRIIKALEQFREEVSTSEENYGMVVGRELTKKFETIYRGTVEEVLRRVKQDPVKGEYTLIVYKKNR